MKIVSKGWKGLSFGLILLFATAVCGNTVEHHLEEARRMTKEGNYIAAAINYKKVLKLDDKHAMARKELKDVLLEARIQDPEAEFSEVEWGLLEHGLTETR